MICLLACITVILCTFTTTTLGHPQCLDFRPPFETKHELQCDEYREFGCCSQKKDSKLAARYQEVLKRLRENGLKKQCSDFVKTIICQECSPYAAHVYDSEITLVQRPFPGLCTSYCHSFYTQCSETVRFLTNNTEILQSLNSQDSFCEAVALSDVDYCYPDLKTNDILNGNITRDARTTEGCMCLEPIDSGLKNPLALESPPDNSGRLFVAEQRGVIYIYHKDKTREKSSFLDLKSDVLTTTRRGDERGFLGFTFHPNYLENRKFYVFYSRSDEFAKIRVSEFLVSPFDPNKADAKSERVILEVKQPYWNHNGGEILFGTDGYLYCFLGDGGGAGDRDDNAQDKSVLLGKVLRIDVDSPPDPDLAYHIPKDNPFVNEENSRDEIYAYGIRNIWRCDMDEGDPDTGYGRGRIICGDVGQGSYEEVDIIEKGGNFGWKGREGYECYYDTYCGKTGPEVLPIHAYNHTVGKSITGGHVYRGCMNPNLNGKYIFADYTNGKLFTLDENKKKGTWSSQQITMCGDDVCFNGLTNIYERRILSFGEDDDGEVYMLSTDYASTEANGGAFYKFVDPRRRGDPTQCRSYNKTYIQPTYDVTQIATTKASSTGNVPFGNKSSLPDEATTETLTSSGGTLITSASSSIFSMYGWQFKWMPVTTCIMVPAWKCYHYFL